MILREKKAEMGVGTLIIFIAMLLVAAVAAGVLIQTVGSLQEKSLATGQQARAQISSNAETVEVSATDGRDTSVESFQQLMKLSPGSESIKLEQVIFTFNTKNTTATLKYRGTNGICQEDNVTGYYTYAVNDSGFFTVVYLQQGTNWVNGNLQRGDLIKLCFKAPEDVGEDEMVRINFVPKIGTSTLTEFNTPDVMSTERVYLYP
jgi:archaeal flagellin FlaB